MGARRLSRANLVASISIGGGLVSLAAFFLLEADAERKAGAAMRELEGVRLVAAAHAEQVSKAAPQSAALFDADAADVDHSLWSQARIRTYRAAIREQTMSAEGILRIDALRIRVPIFTGTRDDALDVGAGRIEGTAALGAEGNVGIAAHRDGHFRALEDIDIGTGIVVETVHGIYRYEVFAVSIVDPEDIHVLAPTRDRVLTLVTCYPFYFVGNAPQRFIVHARGIRGSPLSPLG